MLDKVLVSNGVLQIRTPDGWQTVADVSKVVGDISASSGVEVSRIEQFVSDSFAEAVKRTNEEIEAELLLATLHAHLEETRGLINAIEHKPTRERLVWYRNCPCKHCAKYRPPFIA